MTVVTFSSTDSHSVCLYCKKSIPRVQAGGSLRFGLNPTSKQILIADPNHVYDCPGQKLIRVKITSLPEGDEDEKYRGMWINLEFWTWKRNLEEPVEVLLKEHLLKKYPENGDLHVPSIKILKLSKDVRVNWWENQSIPQNPAYKKHLRKHICFSQGCFEILEEKFYSEELVKSIV